MNKSPTPTSQDQKDKRSMIVEQANQRLEATLTAYDALTDKSITLLSIAIPLLAGLGNL